MRIHLYWLSFLPPNSTHTDNSETNWDFNTEIPPQVGNEISFRAYFLTIVSVKTKLETTLMVNLKRKSKIKLVLFLMTEIK